LSFFIETSHYVNPDWSDVPMDVRARLRQAGITTTPEIHMHIRNGTLTTLAGVGEHWAAKIISIYTAVERRRVSAETYQAHEARKLQERAKEEPRLLSAPSTPDTLPSFPERSFRGGELCNMDKHHQGVIEFANGSMTQVNLKCLRCDMRRTEDWSKRVFKFSS
jgi:hypothetical protein